MSVFKKTVMMFVFALFIAAPLFSFVAPQTASAAINSVDDCERPILGIHPWFRGLAVYDDTSQTCSVASPGQPLANGDVLDLEGFVWRIALNIIEIALSFVGIIAFFFVLYGGFQFLTGGNNASQVESARKTILNAAIGVVISIGAVAIVNLVFGIIG